MFRLKKQPRFQNGVVPRDPRWDSGRLWTPTQTHVWERVSFTVPKGTPQDRMNFAASKYRNRGGEVMEQRGFEVLAVDGPHRDDSFVAEGTVAPDRTQYYIWYKVRRRPVETTWDVPDADVPVYLESGLRLAS